MTTQTAVEVGAHELQRMLEVQRAAHAGDPIPTATTRRDRLDRLVAAVLEHADELADALHVDFGSRPRVVSTRLDVLGALHAINFAREHLEEWMAPTEVPAGMAGAIPTVVQNRPKGVVGVIGPWNVPVTLAFLPAAEALAAGNRVMVKFSDMTPCTGEVFARAVASRMSPEEVAVVNGGLATATAFSELRFDHLFFTGSPKVGRLVAATAGRNLVPVTLELGGKNPAIIAPDADLDEAAARLAGARLLNNGQVCLCPDYVFVPAEKQGAFVEAYRRSVLSQFPSFADNPDVVSVINETNYQRVVGLIDDAVARGATATQMVPESERGQQPDPRSRRVPPTLLRNVAPDAAISHEEIFGPVLVLHTYTEVAEAIGYVASGEHPLVSYWFGADTDDFKRFCALTTSGAISRNDFALAYGNPEVPFGGIGMSGSGAYHGKAGFDTFSHQRPIAGSDLPHALGRAGLPPFSAQSAQDLEAATSAALAQTVARINQTSPAH